MEERVNMYICCVAVLVLAAECEAYTQIPASTTKQNNQYRIIWIENSSVTNNNLSSKNTKLSLCFISLKIETFGGIKLLDRQNKQFEVELK